MDATWSKPFQRLYESRRLCTTRSRISLVTQTASRTHIRSNNCVINMHHLRARILHRHDYRQLGLQQAQRARGVLRQYIDGYLGPDSPKKQHKRVIATSLVNKYKKATPTQSQLVSTGIQYAHHAVPHRTTNCREDVHVHEQHARTKPKLDSCRNDNPPTQ
jgi:hypothetical protein